MQHDFCQESFPHFPCLFLIVFPVDFSYNGEKRRKTENDLSHCFDWMYSDFSFKVNDKLLMCKFSSGISKTCEEVISGVNDTGKEFII